MGYENTIEGLAFNHETVRQTVFVSILVAAMWIGHSRLAVCEVEGMRLLAGQHDDSTRR
jgi:hypothetical protein